MTEKLTVFISGTMRDLPTERDQVANAIRGMGLEPVWAEGRGATNRPPRHECEHMVRICDIYLGLYGLSYGWKFPPDETISATEFEWQAAKAAGKPVLIYYQRGEAEPEQKDFLSKVLEWQRGRFCYAFDRLDDLLPHVQEDLARLVKESFHPTSPDEELERQVIMCLRSIGYEVRTNIPFQGVEVPILAKYESGLLIPQQIVVGCCPAHVDSLIATSHRSSAVYIAEREVPERIVPHREVVTVLSLDDLLALAGPGRAEVELRRAAWDWHMSGVLRLIAFEQFEWISAYRQQLRKRLDATELAYALRCSLQHGENIPFWCKANADNARAIEVILQPILEQYGRRPLLRAGYALEKLSEPLRNLATAQANAAGVTEDVRKRVITAAAEGRTTVFWQNEVKGDAYYGSFIDQLFREIDEPED